MISRNLGWGILPLEIFNKNAQLAKDLKILKLPISPQNLNIMSIWSGAGKLNWVQLHVLIQHLREKRLNV